MAQLPQLGKRPHRFTGNTPFGWAQAIRQTVVAAPSAVTRAEDRRHANVLEVDLDNIVLKAMRKEPEHRDGSAAGLGEDLRRYLAHHAPAHARGVTLEHATAWSSACNFTQLIPSIAGWASTLNGSGAPVCAIPAPHVERAKRQSRFGATSSA